MTTESPTERCDSCAFWKIARPGEGWCQRRAPEAAGSSDRVAHWPTTHGGQGCGEYLTLGAAFDRVDCADCRYWRRPANGLQPIDRGDKAAAWWEKAGLCARRAPLPQSEPGPRAFWRASHAGDSCSEGLARAHLRHD
jgi:hypothetical protein